MLPASKALCTDQVSVLQRQPCRPKKQTINSDAMKVRFGIAAALLLVFVRILSAQTPLQSSVGAETPAIADQPVPPHRKLVRQVLPKYPKDALRAKIEGQVVLSEIIADNGSIKSVEVVSGPSLLANAATAAIHQWQYEAAAVTDASPEVRATITMNFVRRGKKIIVSEGPQEFNNPPPYPANVPITDNVAEPVYSVRGDVTPPHLIHSSDPVYPDKARRAQIQGTVLLELIVTSAGKPSGIQVKQSLDPDLDQSAIDAVRQWEFAPATKDGKPVAVQLVVQVDFHLK